jgi:hypothetical protein
VIDRHRWRGIAAMALVVALLTQLVYPIAYGGLMLVNPLPFPTLLLTVRNVLYVVLLVWAVVRLTRVPTRAPAGSTRGVGAASGGDLPASQPPHTPVA